MTATSAASSSAQAPVQAKLRFDGSLNWMNAQANPALASKFATLATVMRDADTLSGGVDVDVVPEKPRTGVASYSFDHQKVAIAPMPAGSERAIESLSGDAVNDRAIALSHELSHVCDAFQKHDPGLRSAVRKHQPWEELVHSEWRAHAMQAKAAFEIAKKQGANRVPTPHNVLMEHWKADTFDLRQVSKPQSMFANTKSYIRHYSDSADVSNEQVEAFIRAHADWVVEAFAICPPGNVGDAS